MSRADELFIQNCRDIIENGTWAPLAAKIMKNIQANYVSEKGEKVMLVGDGANLCFKKFGDEFVKMAPSQLVLGHASGTCIAAEKLFESGKTVSAGELVPNYLRLAQAEREKLQKEGKL